MKIYLVVCRECVVGAFALRERAEKFRNNRQWIEAIEVDMTPEDNDFSTDDLSAEEST